MLAGSTGFYGGGLGGGDAEVGIDTAGFDLGADFDEALSDGAGGGFF